MLFQHMLSTAKINEHFEALRLPLFCLEDCLNIDYQNIHTTAPTFPSKHNFLFTFLKSIKKFFHTIASSSGAIKINVPHNNNLWCNPFLCNGVLKGNCKSALNVDVPYSASEAYSSKITSFRLYYIVMSLKPMFSNRMLQSSFNAAASASPEHSSLRTESSQSLFTQFLSDFRSPFCENSNNDTSINSAASTFSCGVREGSGALIDERSEIKSTPNCAHPVQLGLPFLCGRQRTSSEQSDDIYFLDSTDDSESSNNETEPDNSEVEEENENYWPEANVLQPHNVSLENEKHMQVPASLKKVRFNLSPEVHIMYAWNYAYRSARKGNWEAYARDRTRFQQRIQRASLYLDPILSSEHRNVVYKYRFADQSE